MTAPTGTHTDIGGSDVGACRVVDALVVTKADLFPIHNNVAAHKCGGGFEKTCILRPGDTNGAGQRRNYHQNEFKLTSIDLSQVCLFISYYSVYPKLLYSPARGC